MRKTNNKEVKQYFDNYLNDILIDSFEGDVKNMAEQYYISARDGKGGLYKGFKTYQEAFELITFNYGAIYYDDMRAILKEALDETEEEANRYNNNQVEALFNSLLYSAYLRKCKAENVAPHMFKYCA